VQKIAFVFPGQGSQYQGMLKEAGDRFSCVKETFAKASAALGQDLWALSQNGPKDKLDNTVYTQPLLLTAGVALWRVWQQHDGQKPLFLAGHSLGEYTALVCANAMSLEEAVPLVALRGRLMQEAMPDGAMAAILGLTKEAVHAICQAVAGDEVVAPANFNAAAQTVIAGHRAAVARACEKAKEKGAKRALILPVSVPSHCALMRPAADKFAKALDKVSLTLPEIEIIHNVDVKSHTDLAAIRACLVKQLYHPVRWVETVTFLASKVSALVECGPGKVLAGLTKRIDSTLAVWEMESLSALDVLVE